LGHNQSPGRLSSCPAFLPYIASGEKKENILANNLKLSYFLPMARDKSTQEISEQTNDQVAFIGSGTCLTGNLFSKEPLIIDGTVMGNINCQEAILLGISGMIIGDVSCLKAEIHGTVKGNLDIETLLQLQGQAIVQGDIRTGKLLTEPSVTFNGHCSTGRTPMRPVTDTAPLEIAASAPPNPQKTAPVQKKDHRLKKRHR
jgi:cytoskeletal protein CcmA (bactofilin family)